MTPPVTPPVTPPLPSLAVANWFIRKALDSNQSITAMKLQKLIYYAHGWCLALYDRPLVSDHAEAWQYGPVFRDVYHAAKGYGSGPISEPLSPDYVTLSSESSELNVPVGDPRILILEKIWNVYGKFSAYQLSNMTHKDGGPWQTTWASNQGRRGTDIPENVLKEYFKSKERQP